MQIVGAVLLALIMTFTYLVAAAPHVSAHAVLGWTDAEPCLNGASSTTGTLISNQGPTGEWWGVTVFLGLAGGDDSQYAGFVFYLHDNGISEVVGEYGNSHYQWVAQGGTNYYTMNAYISGTFSVTYYIYNPDSSSQCFTIGGLPVY
jgi:hypothetical protein